MKKRYSQPDVFFENFALSTSIAAGCEEKPVNATTQCGVQFGAQTVFLTNIDGCSRKIVDGQQDEMYNGLCYHNPSSSYNVFVS